MRPGTWTSVNRTNTGQLGGAVAERPKAQLFRENKNKNQEIPRTGKLHFKKHYPEQVSPAKSGKISRTTQYLREKVLSCHDKQAEVVV